MKTKILTIAQKLDIDGPVFWSVINRGFGVIRAPLTIFCIVTFLSTEEQGTWYTFTSLAALTMLADLGFASITTQFISHEYGQLRFEGGRIVGDENRLDRFMAFIHFSVKFYLKVTLAAVVILIGTGTWYFYKVNTDLLVIWATYSFVGGVGLLTAMFQAIYQGLNKVKDIQINILINSFCIAFFTCLILFLGFKIWALVLSSLLGTLLASIGLFRMGKEFWKQVYHYKVKHKYNFLKETLGLQLRYAATFIASYLINSIYVPAIYKFVSAKDAGQVGLIISIVTVISSIAFSWVQTKIPQFNILVSQKNIGTLDSLLRKSAIQSAFVFLLLSIMLLIAVSIMTHTSLAKYAERIPDIGIITLYISYQFLFIYINSLSLYLRAFKKEPLMGVQVLNALLLVASIVIILKRGLGLYTFLISVNLYSWIIIAPLTYYVFKKNRKQLTQHLI